MKTTVVMVDGHASVRQMLGDALGPDFQVLAEAGSGVEAMEVFRTILPHLVILDLRLPEGSGVCVLRHLRRLKKGVPRLVIFTGTRNEEIIFDALDERPHGFVHKEEPFVTVRAAIDVVRLGGTYFSPVATGFVDLRRSREASSNWSELSEKEQMILQLVAEGCSSKEVAGRLSLSTKTIEHYRSQLMQKLDLRDVTAITRYAMRRGLVGMD